MLSSAGALVGPPWSKRENGFVLSESCPSGIRLYYEPHCDYDSSSVANIGKVDAVVTPANSQVLIKFPLVGSFDLAYSQTSSGQQNFTTSYLPGVVALCPTGLVLAEHTAVPVGLHWC